TTALSDSGRIPRQLGRRPRRRSNMALRRATAPPRSPASRRQARTLSFAGPEDPTGRFTYWPMRLDRGGEVLAPGTPDDAIQFIDVRDLAQWIVHAAQVR